MLGLQKAYFQGTLTNDIKQLHCLKIAADSKFQAPKHRILDFFNQSLNSFFSHPELFFEMKHL